MTKAGQTPKDQAELGALASLAEREHRAGRIVEAAEAYGKILALRPDVPEVHNILGILLAQQGKLDQAVARFEQATALKPDYFEALNNLGITLAQQGKLDQAVARFEQALARKPDYSDALNNLGNVLLSQGKLAEATARYRQTLALRPNDPDAHHRLAKLLMGQGKLDEAAAHYDEALTLRPDFTEAHFNLGIILAQQGKLDPAAACFRRAIALQPNLPAAHNNLGNVLLILGKLDEAAARFERAIALRPDYVEAHGSLGNILRQQGKLDEAAARFDQAIALRPDYAEAHNCLGEILARQGKLDLAQARFEQFVTLRPDNAEAYNNLGSVLARQGKLDEGAARYQQALALRPDYADAQFALASCYLIKGDYERGWPAYEARLLKPDAVPRPNLPRWTGQPLAGRSLLLLTEQGVGDTFQFIRYVRLLKEQGARVVLAAPPALGRLLASLPDLDELYILGSAAQPPHCDFYLPLLSAPGALGTDAATLPAEVPYLAADPKLTDQWREELAAIDGFKIGIAWQGSQDFIFDRWRSIPLAQFAPLARLNGVQLVSLQKGFGSEQLAQVDFPVLDLSGRLDLAAGPFMDTAAVIRNLDLVVAPDTAIAHLAGALGAPVWVALQFSPDWRWLHGRNDSPWYPTMRLFRQTAFDRWPDVFEGMASAVQEINTL